jgi:hypothetical protein
VRGPLPNAADEPLTAMVNEPANLLLVGSLCLAPLTPAGQALMLRISTPSVGGTCGGLSGRPVRAQRPRPHGAFGSSGDAGDRRWFSQRISPTTVGIRLMLGLLSPPAWHPTARRGDRLRVAVIAPPWYPLPPRGYGGIELVVSLLVRGLRARGGADGGGRRRVLGARHRRTGARRLGS